MCEGLAALCYNVNCVMSEITAKGEGIPSFLTLIVFLSSFLLFKETGMCEHFIIFDMTPVFIYTMSSFRCMKGTRTKEGFPHCLHPLGFSYLHSLVCMMDTG
jgi:hypothetical protein